MFRKIPPLTTEQNADALQAAHEEIARRGITSYLDASAGETELGALAALADRGPLSVRPSSAITVGPELAAEPDRMLARIEGLRSAHARPGTTIRTVKMFFDGVIEYPTQTAALLEPYRVNKGTKRNPRWVPGKSRGPTYFRQGVANRAVAALDAAGWQVHVHAIGDRAVRSALDAFEPRGGAAPSATTGTRSPTSSSSTRATSLASSAAGRAGEHAAAVGRSATRTRSTR